MSNDDELWAGWDNDGVPPDPLPLDLSAVSKIEPFPTHRLPPVFRNMVRAVAANKQVPEDLPAMFGIGAISTLAGPRVAVTRGQGWTEPLNTYGMTVMDSGGGKSPGVTDVIAPLRRIQKQMRTEHVELLNSQIDELDAQRGAVSRDVAAANRIEDRIKALEEAKHNSPRLTLGSDTTIESVAEIMSRNGGSAAILDAEGEFFAMLSGRYTKQVANLGLALKAYDGDPYEVGRIGRHQADIERAILTMSLGVQPTVMEAAAKNPAMVERGLLARFMFAIPPSLVGTRDAEGAPYDHDALNAWSAALENVALLDIPDQDTADFPALRLEPAARKLHIDYCQWMEHRLHPDTGDLGNLTGWASKHKGRAMRIAGLLHLVAGFGVEQRIGEQAMSVGIEVCRWAIGPAIAVFSSGAADVAPDDSQCLDVLAWIRRDRPQQFTVRDAQRKIRKNWVDRVKMAEALDRLVALGHLTPSSSVDRAGRHSPAYKPHPSLLGQVQTLRDAA